jgi:SAM-dependent methyltransferase
MSLRGRWNAALARQLRRPDGIVGRIVAGRLNKGNQAIIATAIEALELTAPSVAADLGFGGGIGLRLLLDRPEVSEAVGIDFSPAMLTAARKRFATELADGRLRLEPGSLTELPLPDSSLDGAITVNTVYFLDDLAPALRELARVLRPGGRVVIGIGDPDAMAEMPFTEHGFRLRSIPELEASILAADLELVDHRRVEGGRAPAHLLTAAVPDRRADLLDQP